MHIQDGREFQVSRNLDILNIYIYINTFIIARNSIPGPNTDVNHSTHYTLHISPIISQITHFALRNSQLALWNYIYIHSALLFGFTFAHTVFIRFNMLVLHCISNK